MNKFKRLSDQNDLILEYLYLYKYLDLSFIQKYIYFNKKVKRESLQSKMSRLARDGLVVSFYNKNSHPYIDSMIYSLTEIGFKLAEEKYPLYEFDKSVSNKLKKGYEHHILMIHLLFRYKECDSDIATFKENECFQRIGQKYYEVVRPDSAVIDKTGKLFIFEYEHTNLRRNLYLKLSAYNNYFEKKSYLNNYYFNEHEINQAYLFLVTREELSDIILKRIKSFNLKYIVIHCTISKLLANPLGNENYKIIYYPK